MRSLDQEKLFQVINKSELLSKEETESLLYALMEISESIEKVYGIIIPSILSKKIEKDVLQDLLWELREEFRHIEYHMKDGKITDL